MEQPPSAVQEEPLTPWRAKKALLDMVRSTPGKEWGWFKGHIPDEMARVRIEEDEGGWYACTVYRFNTSKAIYTFVTQPRPGIRACFFEYKGSFVNKDGRWAATPPKLVSTAM